MAEARRFARVAWIVMIALPGCSEPGEVGPGGGGPEAGVADAGSDSGGTGGSGGSGGSGGTGGMGGAPACVPSGDSFFVATTGDDGRSCDQARALSTPKRTILSGLRCLTPGAVLYVRDGVYEEEIFYADVPGGLSWDQPVCIAGYSGERPILRPGPGSNRVFTFVYPSEHHIILDGLVLDAANVMYDAVKITYTGSDPATPAHHIRIQNSEIMNSPGQGLLVGGDGNEFLNLSVHDNGTTDFDHGFYIGSSYNLVEGCRVYRNAGWGVHIYNGHPGETANYNVVRNNWAFNNARVGNRGPGIILSSGRGNAAYNNLVWGNQTGIQVMYGVSEARVFHNTIVGNRGSAVVVGYSADARIENNLAWRNGGGFDEVEGSMRTVFRSNLTGMDPLFVDEAAADFHLRAQSPAKDAGPCLPEVPFDFDHVARPQGAGCDLGAYEFH